MSLAILESLPNSRLKVLLEHFGEIEDPREPWRIAFPLPEVLLLWSAARFATARTTI